MKYVYAPLAALQMFWVGEDVGKNDVDWMTGVSLTMAFLLLFVCLFEARDYA